MKQKKYTSISVRMETAEAEKLKSIAKAEGHFVSRQARYWLRQCIRDYEVSKGQEKPA